MLIMFWTNKNKKHNNNNNKNNNNKTKKQQHKNHCQSRESKPYTAVWRVTSRPTSQLNVSISVNLFNSFNVIGRNVNKQSQICGPHFFNNLFFL